MIQGLPRRHLRPIILALLILVSAAGMVRAQGTSSVIYSTDFSSDPDWVTNNPYTNHWDETRGVFHYLLRDSTNTFVYKKVPYNGESFRLEYDLFPVRTDFQASFRLGLGNRNMQINQGTTIFSEFENGPYGKIMWLRIIDQANQRREVSSYGQSYGGPSVRFSEGIPYHVVLDYSRELRSASITVSFIPNGSTFWGYSLASITNLGVMDRIYLSTIGDFENPSAVAEGDIDNVVMSSISSPVETTSPTTSSPVTATGGPTQLTGTPPTGSLPLTPTTQKSTPILLVTAFVALAIGMVFALARRR